MLGVRKGATTAALAAAVALGVGVVAAGGGRGAGARERAPAAGERAAAPNDSFAHARHKSVPCLTCHLSSSQTKLTFERPAGCQNCHHGDPQKKVCGTCHTPESLPKTIDRTVVVAGAGTPGRSRTIVFRHERHVTEQCLTCHGEPVTLMPVDSGKTCHGCHDRHSGKGRQCALCHRTDSIFAVHDVQPVDVHSACDACHPTAFVQPLVPTRRFCLACHAESLDHHPGHECTTCHFSATPEEYRWRLLKPAPSP